MPWSFEADEPAVRAGGAEPCEPEPCVRDPVMTILAVSLPCLGCEKWHTNAKQTYRGTHLLVALHSNRCHCDLELAGSLPQLGLSEYTDSASLGEHRLKLTIHRPSPVRSVGKLDTEQERLCGGAE